MLRMPVATLRVWERRYGLTKPGAAPGGQRLYSAGDIRRLALIRQLTDLGHAIGTLASLDMSQLRHVALAHAQRELTVRDKAGRPDSIDAPEQRAWRVALVGQALARRLQRPALMRQLKRPVVILGPFDDATQAGVALQGADVDAVLIEEPHLSDGWLATIDAAAPSLAAVPKAVIYGFAAEPVCDALAAAGTALLRAPQPDAVLAQWLDSLAGMMAGATAPVSPQVAQSDEWLPPPRRWEDAALVDFANRPSVLACECRRHLAELLMQLTQFEAYSAACARNSVDDAELHAHVGRITASARAGFEGALDQVALHEGLMIPVVARPAVPAAGTQRGVPSDD